MHFRICVSVLEGINAFPHRVRSGPRRLLVYIGGELLNYEPDLASFRGHRILHGTSLLGGRTRVTALAVEVLRPAPVS